MRSMDRNTVHVQILDIIKRVQYIEYNEVFILLWLAAEGPSGWVISVHAVCVCACAWENDCLSLSQKYEYGKVCGMRALDQCAVSI